MIASLPITGMDKKKDRSTFKINALSLSSIEFNKISALIHDRFGINIPPKKKSLLDNRFQKLLKQTGYSSFKQYYQHLSSDRSGKALSELANAVSTNHTFFNRENDHFEFFQKKVLPEITQSMEIKNNPDLRVWCAGCSSGEESYMLMVAMKEFFGINYSSWDAGLLATDISEKALQKAINGVYKKENIDHLPPLIKQKYFKNLRNGLWSADDSIKKQITFRKFNLITKSFQFKKNFHVIFCRNVMIYFDLKTTEALVQRFYDALDTGGYLFIGHSESFRRDSTPFHYIRPAVYQKV